MDDFLCSCNRCSYFIEMEELFFVSLNKVELILKKVFTSLRMLNLFGENMIKKDDVYEFIPFTCWWFIAIHYTNSVIAKKNMLIGRLSICALRALLSKYRMTSTHWYLAFEFSSKSSSTLISLPLYIYCLMVIQVWPVEWMWLSFQLGYLIGSIGCFRYG